MKKSHVLHFLAALLAVFTLCSPLTTFAATPLTEQNFNAARYANDYPDLKAAFGTNTSSLWNHYVTFGAAEKRKVYATNGDIGYLDAAKNAAATQTVSADSFNYKGYADKYPDLKAAFGYDKQQLYNHYMTFGKAEGRTVPAGSSNAAPAQAAAPAQNANIDINTFDYKAYADKYPDLKAAFGYNRDALYNHYVTLGKAEGRTLTGAPASAAAAPAAQAPAVFATVVPNTISVLGDSISTFSGFNHSGYALYYPHDNVKDAGQMWWAQAAAAKGMTVLSNCSWSGSTVVGDSTRPSPSGGNTYRRINDIAVDGQAPAVILIMMGTNDFNFGYNVSSHKVGEPGASHWDFSGAYDIMLTRMKAAYPNTRIICLTIPPVWGSDGPEVNQRGFQVTAYNAKIREIAAGHGIQVIDTYSVFKGGDTIEGMHPNAKGMGEIAAAVAAGL